MQWAVSVGGGGGVRVGIRLRKSRFKELLVVVAVEDGGRWSDTTASCRSAHSSIALVHNDRLGQRHATRILIIVRINFHAAKTRKK